MGKAPAFQFYVRDWLSDPQLKAASASTKGIWIDLLCFMWEAPERGKLVDMTAHQLAKMTGAEPHEIDLFLSEAKTLNFASVTDHDKKITIENRRMAREEKARKDNADRQMRFRKKKQDPSNAKSNEKVTRLSSSSSSTSSSTSTAKIKEEGSNDPLSCKPDPARNGTPPYQEIIDYLNERTGKKFDHRTKETQRHIKARWNAGHDLEAFKRVIDNKVAKWATDSRMVDFLRPQTLFGTKFESYLNEKPHPLQGKVSEVTMHNIETFKNWEPPS